MAVKRKYTNIFPFIIQEGDCTIVDIDIEMWSQDERLLYESSFSGSAVRNPIDKPNQDAGALIALGRALARAGERLQKAGDGIIKNDIDTKAEKIKQAEKKMRRDAIAEVSKISQEMGAYDAEPGGGDVYD